MNQVTINSIKADLENISMASRISKKAIKEVIAKLESMDFTEVGSQTPQVSQEFNIGDVVFLQNLTQFERRTLLALADMMYAEVGFSDVGHTELVGQTKIESRQLRGVICSLVRKGHISTYDRKHEVGYVPNTPEWEPIVYLMGDAMGLVPHWVAESNGDIKKAIII